MISRRRFWALWPLAAGMSRRSTAAAPRRLTPVDANGYREVLKANRGKVVLADFWATWCGPCREEMPHLAALRRELKGRGFVLVTVSVDEPEQEAEALAFVERQGIGMPAYIKRAANDEQFINSIDPAWSGAVPALFLYDRQGRKAASFIGETETAHLKAAITKLL